MNKKIKKVKDKTHCMYREDLFRLYRKTAKDLRKQMDPLFNTGMDKKRGICSLSIDTKSKFSQFFTQEIIDDFENFLDAILQLKEFPDGPKPFQEFLFENGSRYSLCSCYEKFTILNDIEISYAEDVALYDV